MNAAAPGWYRDPHQPGCVRWWDGTTWTVHVRPAPQVQQPQVVVPPQPQVPVLSRPQAAAAPQPQVPAPVRPQAAVPGPPHAPLAPYAVLPGGPGQVRPPVPTGPGAPRRRHRVRNVLVSVLVVFVVLVGSGGVVVYRYLNPTPWKIVGSNDKYQFTDPHHVSASGELTVPTDLTDDDFTLYADSALTLPIEITSSITLRTHALVLSPEQTGAATCPSADETSGWTCDKSVQKLASGKDVWGFGEAYWLVRSKDESGKKLSRPVVTKILVDRDGDLAAPTVQVSHDDAGNVSLHWTKVAGATQYRVAFLDFSGDMKGVVTNTVVGTSKSTSWKASTGHDSAGDFVQNAELRMNPGYDGDANSTKPDHLDTYQLCVVATDGTRFSACDLVDADREVGSLPYTFGGLSQRRLLDNVGDLTMDNVPTRVYFVALDGGLRSVSGHIDSGDISADGAKMTVTGVGTDLGYNLTGSGFTAADAATFNTRAAAAAGGTGGQTVQGSVSEEPVTDGSKVAPDTPYPVFGTSDLVKYLAKQMIGHTERIDASAYVDQPGAPSLQDAVLEALEQNPYILGISGYSFTDTGVVVTYEYGAADTTSIQKQISDKVAAVVAQTTSAGMSDANKVTALHDWLTAHADYDMATFDAWQANGDKVPDGQYDSWVVIGVLLKGKGVCASYADAFDLLANAAGVPAVVVTGTITDNDGPHAWNKVKVGGVWKAVDVTWDDPLGYPATHQYLMINDSQFTGDATRTEDDDWMTDSLISSYATP